MAPIPPNAVALTAVLDPWLPNLLRSAGYKVLSTTSGIDACELAANEQPDIVVLEPLLDDMSGTDVCRRLRADPSIARQLPILILFDGPPTPELRVAALRVGAWDFLSPSIGDREALLKIATYIEAERTVSEAVDDGVLDPTSGFRSLPGLARRARELAALMTRVSGPLACVVIEIEGRDTIRDLGGVVARAARLSDVVGDLGPNRMGVLAPGTDGPGAVRLATRIGDAITKEVRSRDDVPIATTGVSVSAGYVVVMNAKYKPIEPFELLQRAAIAIRNGLPSAENASVRRFTDAATERAANETTASTAIPIRPWVDGVAS